MTEPTTLASLSSAFSDTIARAAPAIVSVHSHRARASGFVWKTGLIVTADEALADEGEIEIQFADGSRRQATVAGRDHTTDIALLRVDGEVAPIKLSADIPALGSLAVIVAADRGAPIARLGMV
ncbi:MAG TPA: serine protease, partial [Bradyrhizobium sp.]